MAGADGNARQDPTQTVFPAGPPLRGVSVRHEIRLIRRIPQRVLDRLKGEEMGRAGLHLEQLGKAGFVLQAGFQNLIDLHLGRLHAVLDGDARLGDEAL